MFRIVSDQPLPEGEVTIQYGFKVTGKGAPGTGILAINGAKVGSVDVDHENYRDSFPFTGTVKKVTYDVSGEAIHDAEAVVRRLLGRQ